MINHETVLSAHSEYKFSRENLLAYDTANDKVKRNHDVGNLDLFLVKKAVVAICNNCFFLKTTYTNHRSIYHELHLPIFRISHLHQKTHY